MKIIIAPAKKMIVDMDTFDPLSSPEYLSRTREILKVMQQLSYENAKVLWKCSDKIAKPNYDWLQQLQLDRQLTPAILSFSGIQYQYMAPDLFTAPALDYIQENLRVMSGFYGILRPFDGIVPYRLEMQERLSVNNTKSLYEFWGEHLYQALHFNEGPVVNLASKEYAKAVTPYLQPDDQFIDIVFGHWVNDQLKTRATFAKMARGAMVRYMAEHNIMTIDGIKAFDHPDYTFNAELSTDTKLVFVHTNHN